jgi:hypothetical protein
MQELERIAARRSELDALAEELAKQLAEVQAEREELVIAERVLHRLAEQDRAVAEAAEAVAPTAARVAGRAVLLIPHRGGTGDEAALPADYRKILAIVRAADGPVQVRAVGEELGLEVTAASTRAAIRPGGRARHRDLILFRWPRIRPASQFRVALDSGRRAVGGFNWSSQHLTHRGGCCGTGKSAGSASGGPVAVAVTGATAGQSEARAAGVLEAGRRGPDQRGRGYCVWSITSIGHALVP